MRRAGIVAALVGLLLVGAPGAVSQEAGPVVAAEPGAYVTNYTNPVIAVEVGGPLAFVNLDIFGHDLDHDVRRDPDHGTPVFESDIISGLGRSTQVRGLEDVEPGRLYPFYCSVHPDRMQGYLVAVPDAT